MELKKLVEQPISNDLELHTRWEHGQQRVTVSEVKVEGRRRVQRRYRLHGDCDVDFTSTSSFLRHVTAGKIKNLSHDRYFLLNGIRHDIVEGPTILELSRSPLIIVRGTRGIDLDNRGIEVRRILYSCFGKKIVAQGFDPEEVLQEVYLKIAKANIGANPYNSVKSGFSHYVYMACNSLLLNYRKKEVRRSTKIVTGIRGVDGDGDAGESAVDDRDEGTVELELMVRSIKDRLGGNDLAGRIVEMLAIGYPRREIARELGVEPRKVSTAMKLIQDRALKIAKEWK